MKVVFNLVATGPVIATAAILGLWPTAMADPAPAAPAPADPAPAAPAAAARAPLPFGLAIGGYGEMAFAYHGYGADQTRNGGAQHDHRLVFDTTRFTAEVTGALPRGVHFEAEVEFEHGGTGSEVELEYDEFGEFETEVDRGGEVVLEEFHLDKTFGDRFTLSLGRFYVAMGLLSQYYRPTNYLGAERDEGETTVIPQVWDEMGIGGVTDLGWGRLTTQVVSGLDSTGFSSQFWVASGHQTRFELTRATDLAAVGRLDITAVPGLVAGVSGYYGGTSRNRPKADLVPACPDADPGDVAPCGYIHAPVTLLDAHAHFELGPVRGQALLLWGRLRNAAAVSERNARLPDDLGVLRTAVADQALAAWGEVGLDVAPWLGLCASGQRIEPFVRLDHYDTMFRARSGLFDNPRFSRTVYTAGLDYTLDGTLVAKLEANRRRFASSDLRAEDTVKLAVGFDY